MILDRFIPPINMRELLKGCYIQNTFNDIKFEIVENLHLKGASQKLFGKKPQGLSRNWTVNQVLVARKIYQT